MISQRRIVEYSRYPESRYYKLSFPLNLVSLNPMNFLHCPKFQNKVIARNKVEVKESTHKTEEVLGEGSWRMSVCRFCVKFI